MKRLVILTIACGLSTMLLAQADSEPCCNVIHVNAQQNLVSVRDKASGRLYYFTPNATDQRAIRKGDAVAIANNKIISLSGAPRTYFTLTPNYGEPCCAVVSIQPDDAEPCCAVVAVSNGATNQTYKLSVPKNLVAQLKVGQRVLEDSLTGLAIFQTAVGGMEGETVFYGFPIQSGSSTVGDEKWVTTGNNLKGSSGRLLFDNPAGSIWALYIYNAADDKYITSYANVNNKGQVTVVPGQYKVTINNVPVMNVPIKKGHDTKLKCGLVDVRSEGVWYLKDASGNVSYTSGAKPTKILVPVGTYTFELEGQNQPLVVKSGETVEM